MIEKKIYEVGGCVRDKLLGINSNDIDLVAVGYNVFDFSHFELIGKNFPVFLNDKKQELALARVEKKIQNGYNGFETKILNVTIEDDLKRRDLTINSIAYDVEKDIYIDPYDGQKDIQNKILRHTSESFKEDPLRVLRLARFQAKFPDFIIATQTKIFVKQMREELKYLQADRVYKEIQKVFELERLELFFITLLELDVLDILFPNIYKLSLCKENSIYHEEENVFVHTMMVLKELKKQSDLLKLTAIYHDIAKPLMYEKSNGQNAGEHDNIKFVRALIDIQLPNKLRKKMLFIIQNHLKIFNLHKMKDTKIARFFEGYKKDKKLFQDQLIFAKADSSGRISKYKNKLNEKPLIKIFDKILQYSPVNWIQNQDSQPSGEAIKQHIHRVNIRIIIEEKLT